MRNLTFLLLSVILLSACGTTSGIQQQGQIASIDLSKYNTVIVKDFMDGTQKQNVPQFAGRNFADKISTEINSKGVFNSVVRNKANATDGTILVNGDITRYEEGNTALKLFIGMGAGSTYFDANVQLTDALTGNNIGEIVVDKNSWGLGGSIAATQNIDYFMKQSAEKIANELAASKIPLDMREKQSEKAKVQTEKNYN